MNATCPNCGKVLKVKDEWAGKTLKCPNCTKAFKIGGGLAPAQAIAQLGKIAPSGAQPAGPPVRTARVEQKPGIAINWGPIALLTGIGLIVLGVVLFVVGPMRVKGKWDDVHQVAEDNVTGVIEQAIKAQASQSGAWDPRKGRGMPSVNEVNFHPDLFAMSLPSTVRFVGTTSNGKFEGDYAFDTTEVTGTLVIGGITLAGVHIDAEGVTMPGGLTDKSPAGLPMRGAANVSFQLTGRTKDNVAIAELNGKRAEVVYPPERDEDGNLVEQDDAAGAKATLDAARKSAEPFRRK